MLRLTSSQDAEQFEAKRARREGAAPAWASARVEAKKSQQQAAAPPNELDEDDAFEVSRGIIVRLCRSWRSVVDLFLIYSSVRRPSWLS